MVVKYWIIQEMSIRNLSGITLPPNSPWAALNDDVGIEVLGHLTRNCNLPGRDFMFRYY